MSGADAGRDRTPVQGDVLAWQICTGCATTREVPMPPSEVERLMALRIPEREKHDGCYPRPGATRSEWVTNGARTVPDA